MARILVVDDEVHILDVVRAYLTRDGHDVVTASDGDAALALAVERLPDLIVLDVMLPGRSGFEVLRELRARGSAAAVIMLTARDDVIDRVAGLEIGADDYVTKPFEPRELVARAGAVLRRTSSARSGSGDAATAAPGSPGTGAGPDHYFDLVIDQGAREVRRDDAVLALTRVEFDLLVVFASHPGHALTREQLGAAVFGETFDAYDRTIDSHVKNLRRKIGSRWGDLPYVETVRGIGYRGARP